MTTNVIQTSFHSGEWAPALNARVDIAKYHAGAALLRNFFVDYRGGASTRTGTKYILQAYKSSKAVRLIPFQASFNVGYMLEFGDFYIRFYFLGSPVLETTTTTIITAQQTNPCIIETGTTAYSVGDWIYVTGCVGMTQLNGHYFSIIAKSTVFYSLGDLNGNPIDATAYPAYTANSGSFRRVYTLPSPYAAADLALLKFIQNVNTMTICHPSYVPYNLTLVSAANWTLTAITFGASINAPTGMGAATTLSAGSVNYAYVTTAVDINGQESGPSTIASLASKQDLRTTAGTNTISWTARSGAVSYNVYKSELSYAGAVPTGASFGFIGFTTGVSFIDTNIDPDFSLTPPIAENPFQGAGVASIAVTAPGTYTTVPTVTLDAAPSGGVTATAAAVLSVTGTPTVANGRDSNLVGDTLVGPNGVVLIVATLGVGGAVATVQPVTFPGSSPGSISSGATPTNPVTFTNTRTGGVPTFNLTWGVGSVSIIGAGSGYTSTPAVTFSSGAATATATLAYASNGNPSVPIFFDQRLGLMNLAQAPNQFNFSQPGSYYNFNISNPTQASDAISGTLVSTKLNSIKSAINMPSGLVIFSDVQAWLLNGGSAGSPISATQITANSQVYSGASDVPPIVAIDNILYVQSKGSVVRSVVFNFYTNVYTGNDISILSSHLFYGHTVLEWAWAEEPFKLAYAVRDDGEMLILTYLKEQELIGWTHADTNGDFKSVAALTEAVSLGAVDAVYTVVERTINGHTVKYIERFAERLFSNGASSAWCVDAGLQYSGAPATTFTGAEHLAGATVTGLADGVVILPFVMPTNGNFTLSTAASVVTVGLAFTPELQTLALDVGEPTVQGKRKKISAVTARCQDTLGLSIGSNSSNIVPMKDLVVGNVGSQTNAVVSGLVTGDARTIIDPNWTEPGQYYFTQPYPLPATILGVIPEITIGDTPK